MCGKWNKNNYLQLDIMKCIPYLLHAIFNMFVPQLLLSKYVFKLCGYVLLTWISAVGKQACTLISVNLSASTSGNIDVNEL